VELLPLKVINVNSQQHRSHFELYVTVEWHADTLADFDKSATQQIAPRVIPLVSALRLPYCRLLTLARAACLQA
jgi:hypothetical protein